MFRSSRTLLTIHNLGYQGSFPAAVVERLGLGPWAGMLDRAERAGGRLNFLRTGALHADVVSTVSPTYAREIRTEEHGRGMADLLRGRSATLVGILNGIDDAEWDPARDPWIPHPYSRQRPEGKRDDKLHLLAELGLARDASAPLACIVSRLVQQKGFDLCFDVLPQALALTDMQLAVLGTGEPRYESFFAELERRFPGRVCFYRGFSDELAHLMEAGGDMLLMPSRYEPCGLSQMFSQRYGTIPIVRRTGGLADSVEPFDPASGSGTGFVFDEFDPEALRAALGLALRTWRQPLAWRRLMHAAMQRDFSWRTRASHYLDLYGWLTAGRA
jgi:starch synthase